ncbi:D-amino acid aminotransferase [Roseateles oligotrophus]|uniref:D-amino acid aminotransferase n=1 Tax=Roseateles oligotrophus TaxID=1769250 RepID=A0ABT2YI13_9BURK|nr:D-amino acid aminotransferase [Roseateles oligotrophus]MCV2369710.1 D-amino acid aminotransferase [Roseateles oligotrophus]
MNNALPDVFCYLNGEYTPLAEAKISVMDRGFIFGDGVYEMLPVYDRLLFRFESHMDRFERSMAKLRIASPLLRAEWLDIARKLVSKVEADDQWVYCQVTRGVAPRNHVMPSHIKPTLFAYSIPAKPISADERHHGVACISARDFRWERGDIKSTSLLGNVLARQISADQGVAETILLRDGFLTEASSSNVWIVKEGALLGPPRSEHVLEGIRVELLKELCEEMGIGYKLRPISEADLFSADEIILSSATKEVLPVTTLDHQAVGHGALHGKPGPVYARLYEAYQRAKLLQSI